jgi:hypothetical protein
VKSVVSEIRRVDFVRHLELSLVEDLIKYAHGHGFIPGLDRPIRSWLPLGQQQSAGQETLGEDGRQAHGHLSADDLRSWNTGRGLPMFGTDDNKAKVKGKPEAARQMTKAGVNTR